jgi:hypothetical protein
MRGAPAPLPGWGPEGGCNLLGRFFRPQSMLRLLVVLALVAGLGTPARPVAAGGDPLSLVGWWRVVATGETVVIDPSRFEVRAAARTAEGSWVGDSAGRFLTRSYGVPPGSIAPGWLGTAAGFAVDGPNRVLLDRAGAPVARLVPTPAGTVTGPADPARPPSDGERRASSPAAPLPPGLTAVPDLTGRWVPSENAGRSYVEFAPDGSWTGSDGCTGTGGSWLAGPDGAFLATAWSVMTFAACPGVGVAPQVGAARRIGADGQALVLLDADGAPVGQFRRA